MNIALPKTPSFRLDGRRALVTGASRGIGLAAATALTDAGAHVTLVARASADLDSAAAAIANAEALAIDITDASAMRAALAERDGFDIFVNSAGTNRPKPFLDVTEADYDAVMDLNARAAFFATQVVAARMIETDRAGTIIQISSQMGHVGGALRSAYCASKWAVEGMTKALAIDLAPKGIRVNTIAPTFIETAMTAGSLLDPSYHGHVLSKIKLGRLGQLQDIMGAVVFLASDASALMTGTSIVVDGGWTAG
ncbi:NAD(P)-dependent dehydrogenase (short-subunit alcohol dehydrogenase family) [Microvirga lupini]|uniref:NAD(P)-dependent dehydrogenase (Short-subunit alcohol dehydrogenase family) n=1 Tax=Microvirga lupini TaxID=420324 RepID=A0A7W4YY94_9HYPH|nr:SDR family oxidoreductase [Microvirga lupini]MBB3021397.1 NAD(P)-dependent dehydrogenase (short-subunit alcohol dehydrogenase family) [Microvirga lupini]